MWGIDPTFNMGKFYVTVATYTYSHVVKKCDNGPPTFFLAQCLLIQKKLLIALLLLFYTLLKLEPKLSNILAVGTDIEQAIIKALNQFLDISLRCFIHINYKIQRKLLSFLCSRRLEVRLLKDVFGFQQGTVYM